MGLSLVMSHSRFNGEGKLNDNRVVQLVFSKSTLLRMFGMLFGATET